MGYELLRGTRRGLLLQPVAPSANGVRTRLWNPLTAKFTSILPPRVHGDLVVVG
jgi:hypothetical protein